MAIEHSAIPDGERHEPKGISTALIDTVYVSDGASSGVWKEIPFIVAGVLDDVSTASFILVPIPIDVVVQSVRFTLHNAITVANAIVTVTRGGDAASLGAATIVFTASAEGTTFDLTPSGNNSINAVTHKYLKIATDGASTTTAALAVAIKCKAV